MAAQEFHGHVGQVAGRDIINYTSRELWDTDTQVLIQEWRRCRDKHRAIWRASHLNLPAFLLLIGLVGLMWFLWRNLHFQEVDSMSFYWHIGAVAVPALWLSYIRGPRLKMLKFYRARMDLIDTILQDRA